MKALKYFRPGDSVLLYTLVEDSEPQGCSRDTRFDGGTRQGWVSSGAVDYAAGPNRPGWNDDEVSKLRQTYEGLISGSYLLGRVMISRYTAAMSSAQQLCETAFNECIDGVLLGAELYDKEVIVEVVRETNCSVTILK